MRFLPPDLTALSDIRLAALDRAVEREIDRVSAADVPFARTLKNALDVEDEVERRSASQ